MQAERKCLVAAEDQWSAAERFVWDRACAGEVADFSKKGGYLDPKTPDKWGQDRVVSAAFLRTVLGDKYRSALTPAGVSIVNARFLEPIDLRNAELTRELSLLWSRFEKGADLTGLRSTRSIRLDYSVAQDAVKMGGIHISSELSAYGSQFTSLDLANAEIDRSAYLNAAKLTGFLDMNGIRIGSDLFMRSEMPKKGEILRADFADIDLTNARVGQVDLSGAKVSGLLNLDGIMVGRHVHLEAASDNAIKSEFSQIILDASRIGGSLVLMDATVSGELKCRLMDVSQIVIIGYGTTFKGAVRCQWARVKGDLHLTGGTFHQDVYLTGTQIGGELHVGDHDYPAKWISDGQHPDAGPSLVLQNAFATTIPNPSDAWPGRVNVAGLTYKGLRDIRAAQYEPFEPWFDSQSEYSRQPYEQLAQIFQTFGMSEKAAEIRYAGRDRERRDTATGWWHWAGLTGLKWTIGYGYYPMLAVAWAMWG